MRIACFAITVRDYDEAIGFYVKKVGFKLIENADLGEGKRWVRLRPPGDGGCDVLLAKAVTPEQLWSVGNQTGARVFAFLHTEDFWRDYEEMRARGVVFVRPPTEYPFGTVAVFEDLYGNKWDLVQPRHSDELEIRDSPLVVVLAVAAYLFVGTFCWLAVRNLMQPVSSGLKGLIASTIWLALVATMLCCAYISAGGMRHMLVNSLGTFARCKIVMVERDAEEPLIRFGFRLLGARFLYRLRVPMSCVTSVSWDTGQASELAGRDMNDWSVALRYEPLVAIKGKIGLRNFEEALGIQIIGPSGPRETIDDFGRSVVAFLNAAGARLVPDGDPNSFVQRPPG